jgi:hypothetical protein
MAYELEVTYGSSCSDSGAYHSFEELSRTTDTALAAPGFTRYEVRPGGER